MVVRRLVLLLVLMITFGAVQVVAAQGAPTFVSVSKGTADPSNTLTIGKPSGVAAGTTLLAVVNVRLTGTYAGMTAPSGWTFVRRDQSTSGDKLTQAVYVRVAGSSEPASYSWKFAYSTASSGAILAYGGVDGSAPVLGHSGRFGSGTTITAPSVSVGVAGAVVVGFFGNSAKTSTNPPSGMAERFDVTSTGDWGISLEGADLTMSSTGATGDKSAQSGASGSNIGQLVALRPGAGGSGNTGSGSSPPPAVPTNTSLPTITGIAQVGQTLTSSTGGWNPSTGLTYTRAWLRCSSSCTAISGATSSSYVPVSADAGNTLRLRVTATGAGGSTSATSAATATVAAAAVSGGGGTGGTAGTSLPAPLPASTGTTFYVSTSGSDSNPGTQTLPWRTIGKATRTLIAGQRALVRAGTYAERVELSRSGTASAPITIAAFPGEQPIITGRVKTYNAAYARIAGFEIVGSTSLNPSDVVLYVSGGHHLEFSSNEIRNGAKSGIYVDEASHHVQFIGNWIHDNGSSGTFDHGLYWSHGSYGLIANNVVEDNAAYGIHLYPAADDLIVTSNTIVSSGKSGIIVSGTGTETSDRNLVVNNIVAFNAEYGIRSYYGSLVGSGNSAKNNLGYQNGSGDFATGSLAKGLTFSGSISGNPAFVGSGNYRLGSTSAAIDRGLTQYAVPYDYDRRARPNGAAADIGAFER